MRRVPQCRQCGAVATVPLAQHGTGHACIDCEPFRRLARAFTWMRFGRIHAATARRAGAPPLSWEVTS